jgi:hypothetical protein
MLPVQRPYGVEVVAPMPECLSRFAIGDVVFVISGSGRFSNR